MATLSTQPQTATQTQTVWTPGRVRRRHVEGAWGSPLWSLGAGWAARETVSGRVGEQRALPRIGVLSEREAERVR